MSASVRIHNVRAAADDLTIVVTDSHGHVTHIPPGKAAVVNVAPGDSYTIRQDPVPETTGEKKAAAPAGTIRSRKPEPDPE